MQVTIDMAALAAAATAGVTASAEFVVSHRDTEMQTFAPDSVVAFAMQPITWPLDSTDSSGLPQISQAGYHLPKRSQKSWLNGITRV